MIPYNKIINAYGAGIVLGGKKGPQPSQPGDPVCIQWDTPIDVQLEVVKETGYSNSYIDYSIDNSNWITQVNHTTLLHTDKLYIRINSNWGYYGFQYATFQFKDASGNALTEACTISGDVTTLIRPTGVTESKNWSSSYSTGAFLKWLFCAYDYQFSTREPYVLKIKDASNLLVPLTNASKNVFDKFISGQSTLTRLPNFDALTKVDDSCLYRSFMGLGSVDAPLHTKGFMPNVKDTYAMENMFEKSVICDFMDLHVNTASNGWYLCPFKGCNQNLTADQIPEYDPTFSVYFEGDSIYDANIGDRLFQEIGTPIDVTVNWTRWPKLTSQAFQNTPASTFRCPEGLTIPDGVIPSSWTVIRY